MQPDPDRPSGPPKRPRSSRDYRPDLRPMLVLVGLLVVIVLGWLLVSPLILPAR
jgi:hypothetical protein